MKNRREVERFNRGNQRLEQPQDHRIFFFLAVDVDAEPAAIPKGVAAITRTLLLKILQQLRAAINDDAGKCFNLRGVVQRSVPFNLRSFQFAMNFHLRGLARNEQQIRDILVALNHGREQAVQFFCV